MYCTLLFRVGRNRFFCTFKLDHIGSAASKMKVNKNSYFLFSFDPVLFVSLSKQHFRRDSQKAPFNKSLCHSLPYITFKYVAMNIKS